MAEVSGTNSGPIYDPRVRASNLWLVYVQRDLDAIAKERGTNFKPVGNPQPLDPGLYDPTKYPKTFLPNRRLLGGVIGTFGGVRRIG